MNNLLVDTEVVLWVQIDSPNLSQLVKELLIASDSMKWVSHVSLYEIAIKHEIGKLPQLSGTPKAFFNQLWQDGYQLLPLTTDHITAYDQLPLINDHRDPFDRLILATVIHEGWPIMLSDCKLSWYPGLINVIW